MYTYLYRPNKELHLETQHIDLFRFRLNSNGKWCDTVKKNDMHARFKPFDLICRFIKHQPTERIYMRTEPKYLNVHAFYRCMFDACQCRLHFGKKKRKIISLCYWYWFDWGELNACDRLSSRNSLKTKLVAYIFMSFI